MSHKQYFLHISIIAITYLLCGVQGGTVYSAEETKLIEQLRQAMDNLLYQDYMKSDDFLIRWLRARDMKLQEAKEMLQKSLDWRKQNNIDNILTEDFSIFPESYKLHIKGHDNDGRPLFFIYFGAWDLRKAVVAGQANKFQRYLTHINELGANEVRKVNASSESNNVTQLIIIFDGTGYNLRQHACLACIPLYVQWINDLENNYPLLLKKIYIVNAPDIFQPLLRIILPFFHPETRKALTVRGLNKKQWSEELLQQIPSDQLSQRLGGTAPY